MVVALGDEGEWHFEVEAPGRRLLNLYSAETAARVVIQPPPMSSSNQPIVASSPWVGSDGQARLVLGREDGSLETWIVGNPTTTAFTTMGAANKRGD
jgi:hypothetical protein